MGKVKETRKQVQEREMKERLQKAARASKKNPLDTNSLISQARDVLSPGFDFGNSGVSARKLEGAKFDKEYKNQEVTTNELASNELASNELASNELASNELASNELASNELASNELASNKLAPKSGKNIGKDSFLKPSLFSSTPENVHSRLLMEHGNRAFPVIRLYRSLYELGRSAGVTSVHLSRAKLMDVIGTNSNSTISRTIKKGQEMGIFAVSTVFFQKGDLKPGTYFELKYF